MNRRINEIYCIFLIHLARLRREAGPFLLAAIIFPAGMYIFASAIASPQMEMTEASRRHFLAASMAFSLSLTAVSWLGYLLLENRFMGRLSLFATLPFSPSSYVLGLLIFAVMQGCIGVASLLIVGTLLGVPIATNTVGGFVLLVAVMLIALLVLSGISVVIAVKVRSFSEGSLFTDSLGTGLVLFAPVYYPVSAMPKAIGWIGYFLPTTYIASAFDKILAGNNFVGTEFAVLSAMAVVTLAFGSNAMNWREE